LGGICSLLFAAMVINYLDRQSFAIATPQIAGEFNLTNKDIAFINNSFTAAYAVGQLLVENFR